MGPEGPTRLEDLLAALASRMERRGLLGSSLHTRQALELMQMYRPTLAQQAQEIIWPDGSSEWTAAGTPISQSDLWDLVDTSGYFRIESSTSTCTSRTGTSSSYRNTSNGKRAPSVWAILSWNTLNVQPGED